MPSPAIDVIHLRGVFGPSVELVGRVDPPPIDIIDLRGKFGPVVVLAGDFAGSTIWGVQYGIAANPIAGFPIAGGYFGPGDNSTLLPSDVLKGVFDPNALEGEVRYP